MVFSPVNNKMLSKCALNGSFSIKIYHTKKLSRNFSNYNFLNYIFVRGSVVKRDVNGLFTGFKN